LFPFATFLPFFYLLPKFLFCHTLYCPVEYERMKRTARPHGKRSRSHGVSEPAAEYAPGPVVSIDPSGRMVLPKKIREHYGADRFVVRETEGHIELVPVKPISSLFGILPDLDLKSIYRDHDREAAEEDEE